MTIIYDFALIIFPDSIVNPKSSVKSIPLILFVIESISIEITNFFFLLSKKNPHLYGIYNFIFSYTSLVIPYIYQ